MTYLSDRYRYTFFAKMDRKKVCSYRRACSIDRQTQQSKNTDPMSRSGCSSKNFLDRLVSLMYSLLLSSCTNPSSVRKNISVAKVAVVMLSFSLISLIRISPASLIKPRISSVSSLIPCVKTIGYKLYLVQFKTHILDENFPYITTVMNLK